MSGLDPSDEKPGTTKEQGGGANMDQNREGASSTNTSERPLTPRCFNPLTLHTCFLKGYFGVFLHGCILEQQHFKTGSVLGDIA